MGEADIGARLRVATTLFTTRSEEAQRVLGVIARRDKVLRTALADGDTARAERRAGQLLASRGIERIVFARGRTILLKTGDKTALAAASLRLETSSGPLGVLYASVADASSYADEVHRLTRLHVVVFNGDRRLASTLRATQMVSPPSRDGTTIELGGDSYRVNDFTPTGFPGQRLRVVTLGVPDANAAGIGDGRIVIGAILLGFLLLALACAVLVSRSLQQQLAGFLVAARKLAGGDFSAQVTTVGKDEFAGLGEEFNKMSRELERRLAELRQERERVQDSMRRLGEAVASKLDRDALLEIVVRTAVEGVAADAGRAQVRGADHVTLQERARAGNMNGLEVAVSSAEADALRTGSPRETSSGEANAMAHPLHGSNGIGGAVGVVSVGRSGRSFTPSERELFHYLAGQAARSMESVDRHETATRESLTDDLTGLANRRAFDDGLAREVERAKRFGGTLALVLIDLDNFKAINDDYGHPQGDVVLREVARVMRESSREVDLAARHGGEEFALVLPATDLEGAFNLAERVRERIAALYVRRLDGAGALRVTASCGIAAVPEKPADEGVLVAAADHALYEAKRSGKNKSVRAR
jgi:diguanylate cyclase (GGDEF)-like protein